MDANQSPDVESTLTDRAPDARALAPLPPGLDSPRAKLVLLYLRAVARADVEHLARALQVKYLDLFPVLRRLEADGYVRRRGSTYRPA